MANEQNGNQESLVVLTAPEGEAAGIGDYISPVPLRVKTLGDNLQAFTKKLGGILNNIETVGAFQLNEVVVSVNITAGGEIQLLGIARGKGEMVSGVTLKFQK